MNLEPLCAKQGFDMIGNNDLEKKENVVTKALGVLAENGLYAMAVFLLSCHHKEIGRAILSTHLRNLWQSPELGLLPDNLAQQEREDDRKADMLEGVRTICDDLPTLILARQVTERCLTFARYHAKAMK